MDNTTPPPPNELPPQEPAQNSEQIIESAPKTSSKNLYILVGTLILLAGVGVGAYYWYTSSQNKKVASNNTTNLKNQAALQNTTATIDPLLEVKDVFNKVNAARDEQTLRQYLSANSIKTFDELTKAGFSGSFDNRPMTYVRGKVDPSGNKAFITATQPDPDNKPQEQTVIFVRENGSWKFDFDASFNQAFEQGTAEYDRVAANPNGIEGTGVTDLAVVDFVVTPNPPSVSDKKVTLEARIKKVGQTTLSKFSGRGAIDDFDFPINYQGVIKPGDIVRVDVVPYEAYLLHLELKKQTVTPGAHTLTTTIDNENKLGDANKSNNTLTQQIVLK